MRKAKIMLSAIAILAVVGGAFAFKAQRFGAGIYFTKTGVTTVGTATLPVCGALPDYNTAASGGIVTTLYKGTLANSICTTSFETLHGIFAE
jgi:hypothetical protein